MTRLDDDDDGACAWGRWRIGRALNEPVLPGKRVARLAAAPRDSHAGTQAPSRRPGRGAPRLRLVADADGPPRGERGR